VKRKLLGFIASALISAATQQAYPQASPPSLTFDVASIKQDTSGGTAISMARQPGGRFIANGVPVQLLITFAYDIDDSLIVGGPDWITSDRWNIESRAAESANEIPASCGSDPMKRRVQSLLLDRFGLNAHRESRETAVYELRIAKGGSKLQLADTVESAAALKAASLPRCTINLASNRMQGHAVSLSGLTRTLGSLLGRTVVDKTGLTAAYDFNLEWNSDSTPLAGPTTADTSRPSIFTAVEEQLGLKLQSARGVVEALVIDGIHRPSGN